MTQDVFPQSVIERWEDWLRLEMLSKENVEEAQPFINKLPMKSGTKLLFLNIKSNDSTTTNHMYTLDHLAKSARPARWYGVDLRIRKEYDVPRKNEDVTLAFRWNNTFTVKKFFTFGVRRVADGTTHVYQTLVTPLLFYLPRLPITDEEGTLDYSKDLEYDVYQMPPNTIYCLKSTYVLLTAGKTLFAVDVVRTDILPEIQSMYPMNTQDLLLSIPREMIQSPVVPEEIEQRRRPRLSKRPPKSSGPKKRRVYEIEPSSCDMPSSWPSSSSCDVSSSWPSSSSCDMSSSWPSSSSCDMPSSSSCDMPSSSSCDEQELDETLERFYAGVPPPPMSDELRAFLQELPKIEAVDPELQSLREYFPPATPVSEEVLESTMTETINMDDYLDTLWNSEK